MPMNRGIETHFAERRRNAQRLAVFQIALSVVLLGGLLLTQTPIAQRLIRRPPPYLRFGFEGPPRYVQLVQIEASPGSALPLQDVGKVRPAASRRGGGREGQVQPSPSAPQLRERRGPSVDGIGETSSDLLTRALAQEGRVPIFQSDELIIEHLVRPSYPEDARSRGIEGRVAVLARVDTLGHVAEAEVMNASGEHQLDLAARAAVMQCKFRPYLVDGAAREVYAVFRFAFRIY